MVSKSAESDVKDEQSALSDLKSIKKKIEHFNQTFSLKFAQDSNNILSILLVTKDLPNTPLTCAEFMKNTKQTKQ